MKIKRIFLRLIFKLVLCFRIYIYVKKIRIQRIRIGFYFSFVFFYSIRTFFDKIVFFLRSVVFIRPNAFGIRLFLFRYSIQKSRFLCIFFIRIGYDWIKRVKIFGIGIRIFAFVLRICVRLCNVFCIEVFIRVIIFGSSETFVIRIFVFVEF